MSAVPPARCRSVATNRPPGLRSMIGPMRWPRSKVSRSRSSPPCARDREQVQHGVGRSARRSDGGNGVFERAPGRCARRQSRRISSTICAPAVLAGRTGGVERRKARAAKRRQSGNSQAAAIVFAVNWLRTRRARTGAILQVGQLSVADASRCVGADRFVDVLNRDVLTVHAAGAIDPPAARAGDVEPRERHRGARHRLVSRDQGDDAVEQVAARHQLDRVGDDFPADERVVSPSVPIVMPSEMETVLNSSGWRRPAMPSRTDTARSRRL